MIAIVIRAATPAALLAFTAVSIATSAFAQAPTETQREAIKSECRSDYIAHCSSIPPGGAASLECLQKNMANLSAGCAGAVRAVEAPTETKAEPREGTKAEPKEETKAAPKEEPRPESAPATTAAKPAAGPAPKAASAPAKQPTGAQISAIRSACRSDYPKVCAGVPTGGAPALQCLEKNEARLSASCRKAVAAASGGVAPSAAGGAAPATAATTPAAAAPVLALRPLRPREVLFVMRSACGEDVQALCPGVAPGGGRIIECLVTQSAKLSPACRGVLDQFAQ